MKVDRELLEHVAKVARLELTSHEIDRFIPQLKEILAAFEELDSLHLSGVEPSIQPVPLKDALREDASHDCLTQDEALLNAKNSKDGYFKGPGAGA
jgi:aspartyl-tRNA(Asn)/glutamyl-tRNA(Gln) amidotransferase subunit C